MLDCSYKRPIIPARARIIVAALSNFSGSMMKRIVLVLIGLVICYVAYAGYCFRDLSMGFAENNSNNIADHVDFPSLRASIKEQLTSQVMAQAVRGAGQKNNTGSQIGAGLIAAFGPSVVNNMVDSFITPSGISNLLASSRRGGTVNPHFDFKNVTSHLDILSPTRYRLTEKDGTAIVFTFEDWTWKITDIRIPLALFQESSVKPAL
jgi:hypothetical protein